MTCHFQSLYSVFQETDKKIVDEYVNYYNKYSRHQGIDDIPEKYVNTNTGREVFDDVLFGLHHHYYRSSA